MRNTKKKSASSSIRPMIAASEHKKRVRQYRITKTEVLASSFHGDHDSNDYDADDDGI